MDRTGRVLLLVAVLGGALFFTNLGRLWPLARTDLTLPRAELERRSRALLSSRGESVAGFSCATRLAVAEEALDYVERSFGRERAQEWISAGSPLVSYVVSFKKRGDPDVRTVRLHANGTVLGWEREMEEDAPGRHIGVEQARALVLAGLEEGLGLEAPEWEETSVSTIDRPARRDHAFVHERLLSARPELRERVSAIVAGGRLISAWRTLVVPGPARRDATARRAPRATLQTFGVIVLGAAAVFAFLVFLRRLRDGSARLERAWTWVAALALAQVVTLTLQSARLFSSWEPLWPRWSSVLQTLLLDTTDLAWTLLVLLAFIAAGEALDRESGAGRGEALWALGRGRITDPSVVRASRRGFLVGLICGGVLTVAVILLESVAGAWTAIQPRGFFFYALNSASPSLSTLFFFLYVALAEELGYRFFGVTWLLSVTGRKWAAVLVPALIYGMTHTTLDFLPPAEPFWARPLLMTLVGCVWGWAFLRYDALTVVLSHFTADLLIFNWPRLASGNWRAVLPACAVIGAPLVPAALGLLRRVRGQPSS